MIGHRDSVEQCVLPGGRYWIGDLCYVMGNHWDEVCDLLFADRSDNGCNQGIFQLKNGTKFVMFNTAYGNGSYTDLDGRVYGVDSGSIGAILVDDIESGDDLGLGLGHDHEFNKKLYASRDDEGFIHFTNANHWDWVRVTINRLMPDDWD